MRRKDEAPGGAEAAQVAPDRAPAPLPAVIGNAAFAKLTASFNTNLDGVRVHPESPRAGTAHALTDREDVHFAPGRFAPGTAAGDRLIAHELAHVVQQRRPEAPAPALAAELDADSAADSALRAEPVRLRAAAVPGVPQRYEAWEHRRLGDAHGGVDRKIVLPNGKALTYGQVVALSGDFYRSPEALMKAPLDELEEVLAIMDRESGQAATSENHRPTDEQTRENNRDYELATTGHDRVAPGAVGPIGGDADSAGSPHGEVRDGEHVVTDAPGPQAGFLDLASANAPHFSTDNIRLNWVPKHQLALDVAKQAWHLRNPDQTPVEIQEGDAPSTREHSRPDPTILEPGREPTAAAAADAAPHRPDPSTEPTRAGTASTQGSAPEAERLEAQAWLSAGFADHFLTDALASGHLISGGAGRKIAEEFFRANEVAIAKACIACTEIDSKGDLDYFGAAKLELVLHGILRSKAPGLLLKTVHDYYNAYGITVRNALGQEWTAVGDAGLAFVPGAIEVGELASKASRDAVQDVLDTGTTTRAHAALDYIPDVARIGPGGFLPIEEFSTSPQVWQPVLERSLSQDPGTNEIYKLVKAYIRPVVELKARQAGRTAGTWAREWWEEYQRQTQHPIHPEPGL
jgi:hypothetical protein